MYRAMAYLGAALAAVATILSLGPDDMPIQVPSRGFLRGVAILAVALVAVGLVGLAVD